MHADDFDRALQRCFDLRTDPLDDPELAGHLLAHPEALAEFAQLRALLRAAPEVTAPVRRRWPLPLLAAAALVALAATALWPARVEATAPASWRVLTSSLTEQRAPAGAAFAWQTREVLVQTDRTRLEVVEQWSRNR